MTGVEFISMKENFVSYEERYYGGCYNYGSPIKTRIIAYYKNPEDKKSGVVEFEHEFHTLEIGNYRDVEKINYTVPFEDLDKLIERIKYMKLEALTKEYKTNATVVGHWNFNFNNKVKVSGTSDIQLIQIEAIKKILGFEEKRKMALQEVKNRLNSEEFQKSLDEEIEKSNNRISLNR